MMMKGSLQASIPIVKAFLTQNFLIPVENSQKSLRYGGKMGLNVKLCLQDPVTECLTSDIFSMLLCGVSDCIYLYLV